MRGRYWPAIVLAAVLACPTQAAAHPHAWIDVTSEVLFDEPGKVAGLELSWLFDEAYTAFVIEGLAPDLRSVLADEHLGERVNAHLRAVAAESLTNLRPYGYFTKIQSDGSTVPVEDVTTFETGVEDLRFFLAFKVMLTEPVDPRQHQLTYSIYDPTYYIEMLHEPDQAIALSGPGADGCTAELVAPNPSSEQVLSAYMIDSSQRDTDGLGDLFAEKVTIRCN